MHPSYQIFRRAFLLLAFLLVATTSQAHPEPPAAPPSSQESTLNLPVWEQLTPEQHEQLTATIRDRWNNAAPAERALMLARAERWQRMEPRRRERISRAISRWQGLPPGEHRELRALFHALSSLPDSQRADFLRRWIMMTPEQHQDWVRTNSAPSPHTDGPHEHRHPSP